MSCPNHDINHYVDIGCNDAHINVGEDLCHVSVDCTTTDNDTHINVEDDLCHVDINGMENAYGYELWSCFGIVTKIKKLIDRLFGFFEAVTEDEVKDMWKE